MPSTGDERAKQRTFLPLIAFILLTCIWGSSFFFTELALESFGYAQIATMRVALGCAVLAALVVVMRLPLPRDPRMYARFGLLGTVSIAVPFTLITAAQQYIDTSLAVILVSTTPIFVFIITTSLGVSRLTWATTFGIAVAFAGIVSLYLGDGVAALGPSAGWSIAAVACALMFAIGNVYTRQRIGSVHPIVLAFLQLGAALILMLPYALIVEGVPVALPTPIALLAVVELGVLGSALAYVIFSYLIQTWGSTATSLNTYLQPIVGVLLGVLALGEVLSGRVWVSILVIVLGVALFGFGSWRNSARTRPPVVTNF